MGGRTDGVSAILTASSPANLIDTLAVQRVVATELSAQMRGFRQAYQEAQAVEEAVRQTGSSQIDTNEIGLAILGPLRALDEVAYLRFASVYQAFDSLEDFEASIAQLRADHAARAEA